MWKQFKNKLKELFDTDVTESEEDSTSKVEGRDNNSLHTRMAYRYPSDRSFNFPAIPDKSQEEKKQRYKSAPSQREQEKNDFKIEKTNSRNNKAEPEKKKFEPTDVPSPVHGFNKRAMSNKAKEIEKIPAYLRKEKLQIENEKDEKLPLVKNEMPDVSSYSNNETLSMEMVNDESVIDSQKKEEVTSNESEKLTTNEDEGKSNSQLTNAEIKEVQDDTTHKSELEKKEEATSKESERLTTNEDESKPDNQLTSLEIKEDQDDTTHTRELEKNTISNSANSDRTSHSNKKSVPFNVIMTPRDKKTRIEQNRTQIQQPNQIEKKYEKTNVVRDFRPPLHLLSDQLERTNEDDSWVIEQSELLETTLKQFHVRAKVVNAMSGPSITRFEIQPDPGVKVSKIKNLSDDIKLNMSAKEIRMEAPIPGKNTIGIEIPNPVSQAVGLQEIFEAKVFQDDSTSLLVALGLDIAGRAKVTNLKKMPHGLIAGATGSGKSVCINTILISLLYKASHEDVRFLLIDPKMVELAPYNGLPHLVSPVITDVKAATAALKWAVAEMEERYEKFVREGARDIERYNEKMLKQNRKEDKLPYLVIVIDELADLMMVSPQDVEDAICRIAQKARACGIHLLLATQRPSVDVITGLIKANIPTRIAFSVSSQVDSRTILDTSGAEKLLGKGDMLFLENGVRQAIRIQGAFVSDDEIERVTNFAKKQAPPNYLFEQEQLLQQLTTEEEEDEIYLEAIEFVSQQNGASASLLQRRFKIGYNRAARLIDHMQANGIISDQKGSKPRDVLISKSDVDELIHPASTGR
ncbi:DNA translocase FtsK [Aquibacillus saliphilus]|uniref:DNA translocase FtsK n=1 Tax=Aquibacillus saliphilus TaxID=1909422 RepID=UPI001CEFD92C|nr:DNA translocase FtsK [Aquibacillus saliphilus]